MKKTPILCSACLLGIKCRFDGNEKSNPKALELMKTETLIPVCPEQLGGLSTPREPAEFINGKIKTPSGKDVTENYQKGAEIAVEICKLYGIKKAILRKKSPSCGVGKVYDGTFSGKLIDGDGITAKLLKQNGIKTISEDDL